MASGWYPCPRSEAGACSGELYLSASCDSDGEPPFSRPVWVVEVTDSRGHACNLSEEEIDSFIQSYGDDAAQADPF